MILPLPNSETSSPAVPKRGARGFIAPDAWVIGDVELSDDVSIFFGAVLRGDLRPIQIGRGTNIQEHAMLHTTHGRTPTIVGEYVTVGHRAILHGCTVGNCCLIGMGSIILDGAVIGDECLIGAGALVPEGKIIPPRSLVIGMPGKVARALSEDEAKGLRIAAERYVETGRMLAAALGQD